VGSGSPGQRYEEIRRSLPEDVSIVVAAKGRDPSEVADVIEAGATIVGENYVQEARRCFGALGDAARMAEWHLIGHLQRNKVNQALSLFDCIQSVDSLPLAQAVHARADGPVRVLLEVNVAGEESKSGVPFEGAVELVRRVAELEKLRLEGLMTMEPYAPDPGDARPYFRRMRALFEQILRLNLPGANVKVLSMGMTNSFRVAVEEGANMVRIGTAVFGPRGGA
jgi:pyridoxal phosphate enzyme (YggS family)